MNKIQEQVFAGLIALCLGLQAQAEPRVAAGHDGADPPYESLQTRPFLVVAGGSGASISVFSVNQNGGLQQVAGSPFGAQPGVDTVRFSGKQTLVASASSSDQIGAPSTIQLFHLAKTGRLSPAGSALPIPKDVKPWACVQQGSRRFVIVPAAGLPGDLLYGFELVGQGPGVSLASLSWSPQSLVGLMLFGGAAATPDGRYVYQVGYSNSMAGFAVGPDGSLNPLDVHGAAVGQLINAAISSDGRHLYAPRDSNPDQVAGFAIDSAGGLTALPSSPYPLPGQSNFPGHITITPDGRFVIVGSAGDLITVLSRSPNGILASTPVATLGLGETPGAVVCNDKHLFFIGSDALGVRHVFVYSVANLNGGPLHAAIVPTDARDLALSR